MEESIDRISNLPDDIIDHILSFLDMKYVVRTSLLSSGWKDTWTSVSTLYFCTSEFMSSETKEVLPFVRFLDRVLMYKGLSSIEEFHLYWDNKSNEIAKNLDTWIIVALKHSVQRLTIEIEYNENLTFRPPHRLFKFSSLTSLVLDFNGSQVVLPDSMCLPRVEYLDLCNIRIDDVKILNKLLSSCPVLEDLILRDIVARNTDGVSVIESSHLQYLEIVTCNMAKIFKLSTPSLESFICTDYMIQEYSLGNLPSLVTVSINMVIKKIEAEEEGDAIEEKLYPEHMMKYLTAVNNVEKLTLLSDVFQSNVAEDGEVGLLSCGLSHLKYIEIKGMKGCDNELKFVGLVLKEAVVLEEMDLCFSNPEGSPDATESPDESNLIEKYIRKLRALPNVQKFIGKLRALTNVSSCSIMLILSSE
ncbi:F-box protein At4g09920-like [Papaver somniferum]|uniref:F-box protein At4g09920-like n=1 Tax=Papaver somniferum TaxID=3469 RepID=UPI000E6FF447|nr:F-box protein At4g09920-like [Papaver somniferum]